MWVKENSNPVRNSVGDCAVRTVGKVLGIPWETAYARLCGMGFLMGDMPSANNVWGAVLRKEGFLRDIIPNTCPDCYTLSDFCQDHPTGTYAVQMRNHVAAVVDGDYYDTWDCGEEPVHYFWVKPKEE